MVRIGFVVEGFCEKLLVESANFQVYATQHDLEICHPVINAGGGGNLCTKNIEPFVKKCCTEANPDKIVVLTDLECDPCVTATKARIVHEGIDQVIVVKKALEAWFIADTLAMRTWLGAKNFFETAPELTPDMPWQRLKQIAFEYGARGPGERKIPFTQRMINRFSFSIERAANHPNCPSAKYFLEKLQNL